MVSTIMAPALTTISKELDMNSVEAVMALSAFMLATAFGPLVIGPLSEVYGRKPILHASNVWFLIWNLVCGFANSKGLLIAARFLAGFGASAIYSLAGGVLGDVWRPEQRGRSLGIYLLIPLLGAAVGPIIGGFMAARTTWRWMFWSTSAFQAVMLIICFPAFHETYGPTILHRRAEKLREDTGDHRYHTAAEQLDANKTISGIIRKAVSRPIRLLIFHPIIQITALLSAFNYGVLYIVLSTFSDMWQTKYGQSVEISGLHYIACALGEVVGSQIGGPLQDNIFGKLKNRAGGEIAPEYHLPLMLPSGIIAPLGLIMYGWCAQFTAPWAVTDVAVFIALFGQQIMGQPIQAYVIDAYPDHTSSATAASQFIRSLTAFTFPLFAPIVYQSLGYGWGNTTVAFIALAIGIPAPLLLWKYGPGLRARARSSY